MVGKIINQNLIILRNNKYEAVLKTSMQFGYNVKFSFFIY